MKRSKGFRDSIKSLINRMLGNWRKDLVRQAHQLNLQKASTRYWTVSKCRKHGHKVSLVCSTVIQGALIGRFKCRRCGNLETAAGVIKR